MKFSGMKNVLLGISLLALLLLVISGLQEAGQESREPGEGEAPFSLSYGQGNGRQRIKGFFSEGAFYFCLPGYMGIEDVRLEMGASQKLTEAGGNAFRDGDALEGVSFGKVYRMHMETKGEGTEEMEVVFLQGSHIPVLRLATASGNMEYILAEKGNGESGYMEVMDADGNRELLAKISRMAGRGNTAWDAEKKSFILKLDKAEDVLGMGEAKSWILCANYYDGTYVRNQVGFELAEAGGIKYVCDSRFVELYVNDEYMGLYQLMEKIEAGKNRVEIGDQCLLEIDYAERAEEEGRYVLLPNGQPVVIHSPAGEEEIGRIQRFFDGFAARMEAGDVPLENMDMVSFAKMFVMEDILQDMDFGYTSHYLYLDLEKEVLYDGTVWDMDNTMGRGEEKEAKPFFVIQYDLNYNNLSRWYARLYGQDAFCRLAAEEYRRHFRPALEKLAEGGVREKVQAVRASVGMDAKRFPGVRSIFMGDASLEEHVEYLENYLQNKLGIMDKGYTEDMEEERTEINWMPLEKQERALEEEKQDGADGGRGAMEILLEYRFPVILLVMCMSGVILWYKCRQR